MNPIVLLCFAVTAATVVDAVRRPESAWVRADRVKSYWIAVVVVGNVIGAAAYLIGVLPRFSRD